MLTCLRKAENVYMQEKDLKCFMFKKWIEIFTCLKMAYPGQQEGSLSSTVGGKKRILKKEEDHL